PAAPSREAAKYPRVILNSDGAARGNPGPAGAGAYVSTPDGEAVAVVKKYLGEATNNVAEYSALILGLEAAAKAGAGEVEVRADSELMIRQLTGVYKVKHPDMKQLYEIVRARERSFRRVTYRHVPREQNVIADRLSNEAIDERA
ncbi:ribonuclease HI family protein, partial [bacterium]|nr:ribonuclease HI family protein [bacterium]